MKTTKRFLYFAAVSSLLFAACSREDVVPEENLTPGENTGETYPVYFGAEATLNDAASGDDITAGTKVSLTPDADDSSFESSWDNYDAGSIQYSCKDDNYELTGAYKDATWYGSSFTVYFDNEYKDKVSNWKYTLVYPKSLVLGKDRIQTGNSYNSNYDLMVGNASVTSALPGKDDEGNSIVFNMLRETGIAYFHFTSNLDETLVSATLTVDGGTIASEAVSLKSSTNYSEGFKYSGEQYNSINMTFTGAPSALDFKLWFNVLPTKYNSSTLVIETIAHKLTLTKNAGAYSYEKQKLYKVKGTVSDAKWVDLPKYAINFATVEGGTLSADYTEAVRGTLVTLTATKNDNYDFNNDWSVTDQNGNPVEVNAGTFIMPEYPVTVTASFTKQSGGGDNSINLTDGGKIANCYIVPPTADLKYKFQTNNINGSVGDVTSCEVLWESFGTSTAPNVGDLVKEVSYANDYISFTTTGNAGNALIAAKNAEGVILWSWHIWITETKDITIASTTVLDRNLGATSSVKGSVGALGLYYQWGRKDPFIGSSSTTTGTKAKISTVWPDDVASSDETGNLAWANKHPMTYITKHSSTYHWFSIGADNKYNWITADSKKTAYDPCPFGYMVPSTTSWPNLTNNFGYEDTINHGVYIGEYWFPYAGFLANANSSSFQSISSELTFWLNDPSSKTSYIKNSFAGKGSNGTKYGSYALSVRCQKIK